MITDAANSVTAVVPVRLSAKDHIRPCRLAHRGKMRRAVQALCKA